MKMRDGTARSRPHPSERTVAAKQDTVVSATLLPGSARGERNRYWRKQLTCLSLRSEPK